MAQHGVLVARVVVEVVALQRLHLGQPGARQQRGGRGAQHGGVERGGARFPRRQQQRRAGRHARLNQALPGRARPAQFPGAAGKAAISAAGAASVAAGAGGPS